VDSNDVLIPLTPTANPAKLTSTPSASAFDGLANPLGTFHFVVAGASVPGDVQVSDPPVLGPNRTINAQLGTGTPYMGDIPEGEALGLGATMFSNASDGGTLPDGGVSEGPVELNIRAVPGVRTLWTLGGNMVIGDVLRVVGPILNGGGGSISDQLPAVMSGLVPLLGQLESGAQVGVPISPGQQGTFATNNESPSPWPRVRTRIHTDVVAPTLPQYVDEHSETISMDYVQVSGGVRVPNQGYVPLGMSSAYDGLASDGGMTPNQVTDPIGTGAEGHIPLRLAPRHSGLESSPWAYVLTATNFQQAANPDGKLPALSEVIVTAPFQLVATPGTVTTVDFSARGMMGFPANVTWQNSTRSLTVGTAASGATYQRLDLRNSSAVTWSVWIPANEFGVTLPAPAGFPDVAGTATRAALTSVSLGRNPPGASSPLLWEDIWRFDGIDADDLTQEIDAFSTLPVVVQ
jgi:hypothetical protein